MSNYREMLPTAKGIGNFFKTLYFAFIGLMAIAIIYMAFKAATTTVDERLQQEIVKGERARTLMIEQLSLLEKNLEEAKKRVKK